MGYLKCDTCGGSYELENKESPDDFSDTCECGGTLTYFEGTNPVQNNNIVSNFKPNIGDLKPCPHCDFNNKPDAKFCKQCGKKLEKNFINRINDEINLFTVFIGLGVSCIVLIIGSFLFGSIVASASLDISIYIALVLIFMVFLGGTATGIAGCREFKDGAVNGMFMSLIALVILGFVVGVIIFIAMGITASIASAFKPYASSAVSSTSSLSTSSSTSDNYSLDFIFNIIKGIIILVLVFISGAVGGSFGVFLKNGFKSLKG